MAKRKQTSDSEPKRFINPFTDFGFKKIFGEEPNKDLLIDFLNQLLLEQNFEIKDLTYKKNEHLGASDIDRKVVFDLYCENKQGEKFIVEMQKAKQSFFKDRSLYYSTFPIQEQAVKGGQWNYELQAVFAIALLDFTFSDKDKDKTIVNRVQLIDKADCKVFYDKLTFIFIQIPNFNKTIDELETRLDRWLYVLKNLEKFDRIPEKIKDRVFKKVFKIAEYHQLSKNERAAYEDSLKYYRDLKNSFDTAEQDGFEKAEKLYETKLKEAQKREAEERKQREEAQKREAEAQKEKAEAMLKLGKRMKKYGEPIEEIQKETGLSKEEIEKL
jgi:predicted transposase/invertase (TIGR01784 family)